MGVRIAVVITLTTLVSYFHMLRTLRGDALQQMERHVVERSQREQAIFLLAEDNHGLLKTALRERIEAWSQRDPNPRFDSLFTPLPDGSVRSRAEGFDGTRMVSVFVPKGVSIDLGLRRRILAAYDVVAQYGPAFSARFMDTYITLAEGPAISFWPGRPNWSLEIPADFSSLGYDYYTMSLPEQNPRRRTTWSSIFLDPTTQSWMVTVTTPFDMDGRQVASFGHDVLLDELMTRSIEDHLPSAYNLLVRDDGQLLAHPELELEGATVGYDIQGTPRRREEGIPPRFASEAQRVHCGPSSSG